MDQFNILITLQAVTISFVVALFVFTMKFYGDFREFRGEMVTKIKHQDKQFRSLAKDFKSCQKNHCL